MKMDKPNPRLPTMFGPTVRKMTLEERERELAEVRRRAARESERSRIPLHRIFRLLWRGEA